MFERVGAAILGALTLIGEISFFGLRALREAFLPPYEFGEIVRHVYDIGWRSAPLIALSGFAIGVVLSMHTRASLERFGAEAMIPAGLAIALIRETGPLVTGLLVSGRVGAGIGAELGAMKVTEQIDALEAVAVDSFKFLAVTRILACILAMPLLTAIMDFCGIIGGFLAETAISGMSWELYFQRAFSLIEFQDFIPSTMKHNFLLRGFFNSRGYFDLDSISPAEYRNGVPKMESGRPCAPRTCDTCLRIPLSWKVTRRKALSANGSVQRAYVRGLCANIHPRAVRVPLSEHRRDFVGR